MIKNPFKKVKKILNYKFSTYLLIGSVAFSTELLVFFILYPVFDNLIMAQSLSFLSGLLVSFWGNRNITFTYQSKTYAMHARDQLFSYIGLALTNLLFTNVVIHILVNNFTVQPAIAKVIVMVMVVFWNYLMFNKFIFRSK